MMAPARPGSAVLLHSSTPIPTQNIAAYIWSLCEKPGFSRVAG